MPLEIHLSKPAFLCLFVLLHLGGDQFPSGPSSGVASQSSEQFSSDVSVASTDMHIHGSNVPLDLHMHDVRDSPFQTNVSVSVCATSSGGDQSPSGPNSGMASPLSEVIDPQLALDPLSGYQRDARPVMSSDEPAS